MSKVLEELTESKALDQYKIAIRCGDVEEFKNLMNSDFNLSTIDGSEVGDLLHLAIENANLDIVQLILSQPDINPNIVNSSGRLPLHVACENNQINIIQALLNCVKINPNQKHEKTIYDTFHGMMDLQQAMNAQTPLSEAIDAHSQFNDKTEVITELLSHQNIETKSLSNPQKEKIKKNAELAELFTDHDIKANPIQSLVNDLITTLENKNTNHPKISRLNTFKTNIDSQEASASLDELIKLVSKPRPNGFFTAKPGETATAKALATLLMNDKYKDLKNSLGENLNSVKKITNVFAQTYQQNSNNNNNNNNTI